METIGERWNQNNKNLPIQIGDISRRGGGKFSPHGSHKIGTNADIRPFRTDGQQLPATWQDKNYDREKTRELIKLVKQIHPNVKILFNDPVLIKEGLTHHYKGHDNHLHFNFKIKVMITICILISSNIGFIFSFPAEKASAESRFFDEFVKGFYRGQK